MALALGVGVGVAACLLLVMLDFDLMMVLAFAFGLGVGVGVGRTVRASFTLTALGPFVLEVGVGVGETAARSEVLLFDDLTELAAFKMARPPSVANTAETKTRASIFFIVKLLLR